MRRGTGLYGFDLTGTPSEASPEEQSRLRYRALLKQKPRPLFCDPLSADQRAEAIMQYAALQHEEMTLDAWLAKIERKQARASQSGYRLEETVAPAPLPTSQKPKHGSGMEPAGSSSGGTDAIESYGVFDTPHNDAAPPRKPPA